ncbi:putative peroxidase family protein [Lyophyllum shimeji]|uniref:Peroxidase n=1 Tax=Lyophyllum shimeji TaxID=47721 RepID=A0A9P3PF03_LYOSH|nr:putative peroxidase family protein [Lyophyllum shimeji]
MFAMLHSRFRSALLLSFAVACLADDTYRWPSPQYDQLEALLYEGRRGDGSSLASLVHPCRFRPDTNASIAAEWVRFAFHDMSTYDASNGTGGLDGSIAYELGRPENFGAGFTSTLSDFEVYPNKYVSRADIIALGAVFGTATCGGPIIPYRGGRVDAWTAGPGGVPEPHQDLQTHKDMFTRAGFSTAEMIQLTACGHTLGGLRSTDFPNLVPPAPNTAVPNFANFDTTTKFDNVVVTQYLDGTTQNPLVVSSNQTMRSDLRIFSADSNDTMHSLATADAFASTCQDILTRMINTVPHGVALTNDITLLPAKVHDVQLTFERGVFVFKASLRLLQVLNTPVNKQRAVKIFWCDRYGANQDCKGNNRSSTFASKLEEDPNLSPVTQRQGYSFVNYNFVVPVDASKSISKFWFEVDENDGKGPTAYKNGGDGYPVAQDQVLFVPTLSKSVLHQNSTLHRRGGGKPITGLVKEYTIVAAVRDGSNPSRVYMDALDVAISGFPSPFNTAVDLKPNSDITPSQGYSFYSGTVMDTGFQLTVDIHSIAADGTTYTEDFRQTAFLDNTPYLAPTNVTSSGKSSSSSSWSWRLAGDTHLAQLAVSGSVVVGVMLSTLL